MSRSFPDHPFSAVLRIDPTHQTARVEEIIVRLPFRIHIERQVPAHLYVELGFQHGRLADLVQLLAELGVMITDLEPDRFLYHVGMPERFTEVTFLAKSQRQKDRVLGKLAAKGFTFREFAPRE